MASKNKTEERISEITPEIPEAAAHEGVIALNSNSNLERLVNKLYRVSYYAGAEAFRTVNQLKRSLIYSIKNNALTRYLKTGRLYKKVTTAILGFAEDVLTPFVRAGVKFKKNRERIKEKRKESFSAAFAETISSIAGGLNDLWRCIVGVSNYIAPVFGVLLLIATVNFFNGLSFGLEVEYGGKTLGYVRNETEFQKADQMMQERIVYGDGDEPVYNIPTFRAAIVDEEEFTSVEDLCDEIIKVSGSSVIKAAGLYVDDKFYGAVLDRNKDSLSNVLNGLIDKNRTGEENEKVFFAQNVRLVDGLYPQQSIANYTDLTKLVTSEVEGERKYTVESGDSAWSIAKATDVSLNDLLLNNPGIEKRLMPGDEVVISKAQPFLPIKVSKVIQYEEETQFKTEISETKNQAFGYTKVLQKGENGVTKVTAEVTLLDGVQVEKKVIARETLKEAVVEKLLRGTKLPTGGYATGSTSGSGKFGWPLAGGRISCGYMGYRGHTGVDLVLYRGAPIYAADSGVVTTAKTTGGGYGNHVIINHGNGYTTLYGHMSKRVLKVGQQVKKGDLVGYIGSTGNSSGPHLHFEIRYLGRAKNPMSFY